MSKPEIEVTFANREKKRRIAKPIQYKVTVPLRSNTETIVTLRTKLEYPIPQITIQTTDPLARAYISDIFGGTVLIKVVTANEAGGSLVTVFATIFDGSEMIVSPSPTTQTPGE